MSQLALLKLEKRVFRKAQRKERRRMAKDNKETEKRQLLEELERELEIVPEILLNNNGPDDTDLINTVTNGSFIEIEKVIKERDAYSQEALKKSLMIAAMNGQKFTLILLLKDGANANWTDENGNTPLMVCAEKGFLDMAKILLDNKADAKKSNTSGNTALILSIKASGAANMVKLVILSSDVNVKNHEGQTALSKAVNSRDYEMIHILVLNEANLDDVINDETIQELAAKNGILPYLKVFSDCKISRYPPFIAALKYGDPFLLETILTYESNGISQTTTYGTRGFLRFYHKGKTRFYCCGFAEITKYLVSMGADLNCRGFEGGTALDIAVKNGHLDCAKILLEEKANTDFFEAYKLAISCQHLCLVEHLDDFMLVSKDNSILKWGIESGNIEIFQYLINQVRDVNESIDLRQYSASVYPKYLSPLHIAVIKKKPDFIKVLLQSKADINIKDSEGNTPLFYAVQEESSEMLRKKLKYRSDGYFMMINQEPSVDERERQSLSIEIVSLLIEWKADTCTTTKKWWHICNRTYKIE